MFENNILTFNPKWDHNCNQIDTDDVRDIYKNLKSNGIETQQENLATDEGPGSFVIMDPDGNAILIDQHTT